MKRLKISVVCCVLIFYWGAANAMHPEPHGEKLGRKRQRVGNRREKEATWKLIDFSNISMSADQYVLGRNSSEANDPQVEAKIGSKEGVLQRISERLSALLALDQQRMKHLESLDYRYTRLEVHTQERAEGIRSELREISRRVQQLDWQSSKIESVLDTIKEDARQGLEQTRGISSLGNGNSGDKYVTSQFMMETQSKLQTLQISVQAVRSSLGSCINELSTLKRNITNVANMTSESLRQSKQLPTMKQLNAKMMELKSVATHDSCMVEKLSAYEETLPVDCWDLLQNGYNVSGIYKIRPPTSGYSFYVYCEMETRRGGWTVLQNRNEGALDFYKDWQEYKLGFGNLQGEFWLGLQKIYQMTSYKLYEILFELKDHDSERAFSLYDAFAIGSEVEGYPIRVLGKYKGTAGDSMVYHAGQKFSTMDVDNDNWPEGSCAVSHVGAWWYNGCDTSNLNGRYLSGELPEEYEYQGVYWYDWHGPKYSLLETRISIRPLGRFPQSSTSSSTTEASTSTT